jgi:hypothetical protein
MLKCLTGTMRYRVRGRWGFDHWLERRLERRLEQRRRHPSDPTSTLSQAPNTHPAPSRPVAVIHPQRIICTTSQEAADGW